MEGASIDFYGERETIVRAAFAVLSRPDTPVSRRELARKAGVTTATLQRHFRSLADLQAEVTKAGASVSRAETDSDNNRVDG